MKKSLLKESLVAVVLKQKNKMSAKDLMEKRKAWEHGKLDIAHEFWVRGKVVTVIMMLGGDDNNKEEIRRILETEWSDVFDITLLDGPATLENMIGCPD